LLPAELVLPDARDMALRGPALELAPDAVEGVADKQHGPVEALDAPSSALVCIAREAARAQVLEIMRVRVHLDCAHLMRGGGDKGRL